MEDSGKSHLDSDFLILMVESRFFFSVLGVQAKSYVVTGENFV
jgi:hypothetical protein